MASGEVFPTLPGKIRRHVPTLSSLERYISFHDSERGAFLEICIRKMMYSGGKRAFSVTP